MRIPGDHGSSVSLQSTIRKGAWLGILALVLAVTAGAEEPRKLVPGIRFNLGVDTAVSQSKYGLEPYPGWETNFNLPRYLFYNIPRADPFAPVKNVQTFVTGDIWLGVRPTLRKGHVEIGFPVQIYLSNFFPLPVTKVKVDLEEFEENESLTVSKIGLVKRTPAVGIALRFGEDSGIEVQVLTYGYTLNEYHYEETAYDAEARHRTGVGGMFYYVTHYTEYDSDRIETIAYSKGQAVNISIGVLSDGVTFAGFLDEDDLDESRRFE
ncbi:MAG: hypothetical protein NTZ26_09125 [Candidatus Aminicenantes bacterium]|nr:hypothetical protein [Candidatus Aminicenantes bacterium]